MTTAEPTADTPLKQRVLVAAEELLTRGGVDALTNRAIAAAAHTQPPVIYRIFGDKQGLLDAVAARQFEQHLADKSSLRLSGDPVEDLRAGWDQHVAFGLANPAVYVMVYGDVREGVQPQAAREAEAMLAEYIHRVARAGRLSVPEPLAVQLLHSAGRGVTLTLLGLPAEQRDPTLSVAAREAAIAAITDGGHASSSDSTASHAIALRARVSDTTALTEAERALLVEWLDRIGADRDNGK